MIRLAAILWVALAGVALALDPREMLPDPAQEARARELDHALRCVVCQSESVASSNADWAVEARRVIREQVAAGQSNDEVVDFFVERYGEFVLMTPRTSGSNWLLWAAGPLMLVLAALMAVLYLRGRSTPAKGQELSLSPEESARLREIMKD